MIDWLLTAIAWLLPTWAVALVIVIVRQWRRERNWRRRRDQRHE